MATPMLKFATLISDIELPFYTSLASHKINHDKLNDSARPLLGLYEIRPTDHPDGSCRLQIHGNALTADEVPAGYCRAEGIIKNVNTIEEYKNLDKGAILSQSGRTASQYLVLCSWSYHQTDIFKIWDAINDGTIYSCPSLLASFSVICFADLKKYKFIYQFAFPVLHSDHSWRLGSNKTPNSETINDENRLEDSIIRLTGLESTALVDSVQTWRYSVDERQYGFFIAKKERVSIPRKRRGTSGSEAARPEEGLPTTPEAPSLGFNWVIGSLANYHDGFFNGVSPEDRYVCFVDPSTYPTYPGWMLRNLLVLIRRSWQLQDIQILCYRDIQARRDDALSIILRLEVSSVHAEVSTSSTIESVPPQMPKVTGWERNAAGKVMSKVANLGEYMDPQRLADQAVDLNLKLIKWRIAPDLDLDSVKNTKCLLLGAGTLGSYVARNLLGWGVRKITFVDNGAVSFSNPVRQPLFNFQDCLAGGVKKATRASAALKEIYPGTDSSGYVMSVPMVGHPINDEFKSRSEFDTLKRLIDEHDAIFLLMDTRESRWLPTVMGKAAGKIVMNAALGFDTFVVMRHGLPNPHDPAQELGCYFCNDVVAPMDSLTDRTLDQQCTVTRPGIAAIASALLVEMLVSVIQHPRGALAPGFQSQNEDRGSHPLGIVPHQIRGYLSDFRNMIIKGSSYDCCSACSKKVIGTYQSDGWQFVKKALDDKGYVEELSGLAAVQRAAEKALAEIEWSDEGGVDNDEYDGEMI